MSAREALVDTPEWELEVLLSERARDQREQARAQRGG